MSFVEYALDENVAVVTLNDDENRFNPDFLTACLDVLDEVENKTDASTLVMKSSHEKIFSNGIDLEWLVPVIQKGDINTAKDYFYQMNALFRRIVTYPMITIAAITGHAFAGGAILCCAFDFRFMRSDRGYFCFPEVDLGIPFLPGMNAMLKKAIPRYKLEEMEYTGKRLTAEECEDHHIITKACHIDELMDETLAFAKTLNKKRAVIKEMKERLNKNIIHALDVEDAPYIESGKFNI
jgi:enoyl-CoA hydratase/carnithine racemase